MKHIFSDQAEVKRRLIDKFIFLFLDYDGTLARIADRPEQADLPAQTRELLKELRDCARCKIAIISGRGLEDIKGRIGLEGIIYAGSHGLEIEGPKIKFKSPVSSLYMSLLRKIKDDLEEKISSVPGAFIEDKGLTLSLHYRQVDKRDIQSLKTVFDEAVSLYLAKDKIRVKTGKMVFEIQPPVEWDKGKVTLWLLARQNFALKEKVEVVPLYIGDDVTDEDAFRALGNKGIVVRVGELEGSRAEYYLKNTDEVFLLLKDIKGIVS